MERAGGPLPALRQIIETDVGGLLHRSVPHINAVPKPERTAVLQAVTDTLDEFFYCLESTLFQTYYALPDEGAQHRHLAEYQRTLLQLLGHLLRYTSPGSLRSKLPPQKFQDACCHYLYRALNGLLEYTIQLAGGRLNPNTPLPPTARTLLQEIIAGDVVALRQHLEEIHVSPGLAEITLAPFEALRDTHSVSFYKVHYLRTLQQAFLQPPLPGHESTGNDRVCWTLVTQNFNDPRFIAWFYHAADHELTACSSPEARHRMLDRYKTRLVTDPRTTLLAWQPQDASVREQLTVWLEHRPTTPANGVDPPPVLASSDADASGGLEEEAITIDFTLRNMSPQVFAVIANAARILRFIFWGKDGKDIADMVSRIPSVNRLLNSETVRRGLSDLATMRAARELLKVIVAYFDDLIRNKEEKLSR